MVASRSSFSPARAFARVRSRLALGAVLAVGAASSLGCVYTSNSWQPAGHVQTRTLQVEARPGASLDVESTNGRVAVEAAPRPDISIVAEIRATSQERAEAAVLRAAYDDGGALRVGVDWPDGRREDSEGATIRVEGPAFTNLRVRTSNAGVLSKNQRGRGDFASTNGRVHVEGHEGPVEIVTSNASVDAIGVGGPLRVRSSNGGVEAELARGWAGPVEIVTSNAAVRLRLSSSFVGGLSAATSNAKLRVQDPSSRARLVYLVGSSVDLVVGEAAEPRSRVSTSNGSVTITLEP